MVRLLLFLSLVLPAGAIADVENDAEALVKDYCDAYHPTVDWKVCVSSTLSVIEEDHACGVYGVFYCDVSVQEVEDTCSAVDASDIEDYVASNGGQGSGHGACAAP